MECKLTPHTKIDIFSTQELSQRMGWQITAFDLPKAWAMTQGDGVTVAVVDTGCDLDHPDLVNNLLEGYNAIVGRGSAEDDNDHGSAVTGVLCANNNDTGMIGVAPRVKVIPIKVLNNDGIGDMKTVANGIEHGIERSVDMMCVSLGSARPAARLRRAIQKATKKGIPIFCAGGNISKIQDAMYPARYPETIAIAALDKDYRRADFSNTSRHNLDFLAPGVDILSTVRNGWYAVFSGSSMAVPFAASCCALALSAKRQYNYNLNLNTVEDYRELLRRHAIDPTHYHGDAIYMGFGIIEPQLMLTWIKENVNSSVPKP